MHSLYFSGMVYHGGRKVAVCRPGASETDGMVGLWVYMAQNGGLSAIFPIATMRF